MPRALDNPQLWVGRGSALAAKAPNRPAPARLGRTSVDQRHYIVHRLGVLRPERARAHARVMGCCKPPTIPRGCAPFRSVRPHDPDAEVGGLLER
jgi:hypothetical protein